MRIRWIRKILASWIRIRKNMRIPGSKGQNINQKLQKKIFYWNREIINISWKGSTSFSVKNKRKKLGKKFDNSAFLKIQ